MIGDNIKNKLAYAGLTGFIVIIAIVLVNTLYKVVMRYKFKQLSKNIFSTIHK